MKAINNVLISPSRESIELLRLFGIDTSKTVEAHIHFRVNEPVMVELRQYVIVDTAIMAEVESITKHYILTEEE